MERCTPLIGAAFTEKLSNGFLGIDGFMHVIMREDPVEVVERRALSQGGRRQGRP